MINKKIKKVLIKIFPKNKIPKKIISIKHGLFSTWDSLKHFNLLLELENEFKVKFSSKEMSSLKDMKEIIHALRKKI